MIPLVGTFLLLVVSTVPCVISASPLLLTKREVSHVANEEDNLYCFKDRTRTDQDYDRAPCPAGSYIPEGSLVSCALCTFNEMVQTYNPKENYCNQCIECPVCPKGYRVKVACTRKNKTECEPDTGTDELTTITGPTIPSVSPAVTNRPTVQNTSLPWTTTAEPLSPGSKRGKKRDFDMQNPLILVPVVSLLSLSLLAAGHFWRKYRRVKAERDKLRSQVLGSETFNGFGMISPPVHRSTTDDDDDAATGQRQQDHPDGIPEDVEAGERGSLVAAAPGQDVEISEEDEPGEGVSMMNTSGVD